MTKQECSKWLFGRDLFVNERMGGAVVSTTPWPEFGEASLDITNISLDWTKEDKERHQYCTILDGIDHLLSIPSTNRTQFS